MTPLESAVLAWVKAKHAAEDSPAAGPESSQALDNLMRADEDLLRLGVQLMARKGAAK